MRSPRVGLTSDPGRFQPGALSPVRERPEKRPGQKNAIRAGKNVAGVGVLDRVLLLAEIVSALVVAWLVGQYIYTVYFDTAPHRLTPSHISAPLASIVRPTRTTTFTPTAQLTPTLSLQTLAEENENDADFLNRSKRAHTRSSSLNVADTPTPTVTLTSIPTPTPTIDPALLLPKRLRIPVMFLDSPINEVKINMGAWEVSPMDIGHHEGTANPGEVGNVVLAGHRDINSALFRELDRLKPGDAVFVSNSIQEYKYVVTDSFVVSPTHTEVMDPTDDKRVTLITCTPIGLATQRLIVTAVLDGS
jgi:LPXTG-site transpeptidase (sortase) family protein